MSGADGLSSDELKEMRIEFEKRNLGRIVSPEEQRKGLRNIIGIEYCPKCDEHPKLILRGKVVR